MSGQMRVGSLFSGYEGIGMAVERVWDAKLAWVSDIDPGACKILAHRYPDLPNHGDITKIDWNAVEPVDILTGGFPCQDLSHAGKRAGLHGGTRSGLWSYMAEAIATIRPRYVVAENVRGLLSASATSDVERCSGCMGDSWNRESALRALGCVLGDLADSGGYDVRWTGIRAADVGAPHNRFRVFVLATDTRGERHGQGQNRRVVGARAESGDRGAEVAADAERIRLETGRRPGGRTEKVAGPDDRLGALSSGDVVGDRPTDAGCADRPVADPHALGGPLQTLVGVHAVGAASLDVVVADDESVSALLPGQRLGVVGVGAVSDEVHASTLTAADADRKQADASRFGNESESVAWGVYEPAIRRWERVLGRQAPPPTELSPKGSRRLSPRFVEWLMGLPEGWVTDVPDLNRNAQLKALGNGVVSQQAYAAITYMLNAERMAA